MTKIRFDSHSLKILKNFATINQSILFRTGTQLATCSALKTIIAKAKIDVEFPRDFAIYDLSRFLSVLSLMGDPVIDVGDNYLTIVDGKKKVKYSFADANMIVYPTEKPLIMPSVDVSFDITPDHLQEVQKAMGILGVPEFCVFGDGSEIFLRAINSKDPGSDTYDICVGETDKVFKYYFKQENMKMLPLDYHVDLCIKGISKFENPIVTYWVAIESHSKFEG